MKVDFITAPDAPDLGSGYAQCVSVSGHQRTVYVSAQSPMREDGTVPTDFAEQAELAWANVAAQLRAAGLGLEHVVKHTTYLSDRAYRDTYRSVRQRVLGDHQPALTVIIADIFDADWLLEIEAIAVA